MRLVVPTLLIVVGVSCTGLTALDPVASVDDTGSDGDTDTDTDADTDTDTDVDTDTDTDVDADTDTDVDADTDTDPVNSPPTLVSFEARDLSDRIEIAFRVSDPDGDVVGGTFELGIDGSPVSLAIPGDLAYWNPTGESTVVIPLSACDSGSHSFSGRVFDATGLSSSQLSDSVTLSGGAVALTETGDDLASGLDLGTISPPTNLCGDLYSVGNDSAGYTGDLDYTVFDVSSSASYSLQLTWADTGSDYDLFLFDSWGDLIDSSIQDGTTQPESIGAFLWSTDYYIVAVGGWSGNAGTYTISVQ